MDEYIGRRIRRLRKEHGLSIEALSKLWGCSSVNVTHVELGHHLPSAEQIVAFGATVGVSFDALAAGVAFVAWAKKAKRPKSKSKKLRKAV